MIRLRQLLTLSIILGLVVSLGAGCNKTVSEPSSSSTQDEPMEISVAIWDLTQNIVDSDPLLKKLEQKLNIKIKPIEIMSSDYVQLLQMWASSDQLPDIFAVDALGTQYYRNWISQGVIKSVPENLDAYPHLESYLSNLEIQDLKENGKLYSIPRKTYDNTDYNVLDRVVAYRWDLAQKAGITKEPETWNEFRIMLKAIVDKDPEHTKIDGLSSSTLLLGGLFWLYGSPAATSDGSGSDFKWIKEDDKFIPAVFSKNSIASLRLLRDFYTSGLIDPDLPSTKGEVSFDKFAQGKVAAFITSDGTRSVDRNIYKNRWLELHPDDKTFYDKIKLLKPLKSLDGNRYHAVFNSFWSESYISAKVDDKKMDRILQLFDYLNTPEFLEMKRFGLQGTDYTKSGDTITALHPDIDLFTKYPSIYTMFNLLDWDGMFKLNPAYTNVSAEGHQALQELIDFSMKTTTKQTFDRRLTYLSTPTKDGFSIYDNDDMVKVMLSSKPVEVIWQEIIDGYKAKGLDKMIAEVNARAKEMGIE
ncbi:extracellular solute-binding protein [Paenibacillus psychroresistens]|nr:extracellular solute-binding protein [Paenibacillus psychroresistens]